MNAYDIIRRPRITEKSVHLQNAQNTYTFEVHQDANKVEIRKAVETLFKVKVARVTTLNRMGKARRIRGHAGQASDWKQARVTLADGQSIEGI